MQRYESADKSFKIGERQLAWKVPNLNVVVGPAKYADHSGEGADIESTGSECHRDPVGSPHFQNRTCKAAQSMPTMRSDLRDCPYRNSLPFKAKQRPPDQIAVDDWRAVVTVAGGAFGFAFFADEGRAEVFDVVGLPDRFAVGGTEAFELAAAGLGAFLFLV